MRKVMIRSLGEGGEKEEGREGTASGRAPTVHFLITLKCVNTVSFKNKTTREYVNMKLLQYCDCIFSK